MCDIRGKAAQTSVVFIAALFILQFQNKVFGRGTSASTVYNNITLITQLLLKPNMFTHNRHECMIKPKLDWFDPLAEPKVGRHTERPSSLLAPESA